MILPSLAVVVLGILVLWWARACHRGTLRRSWVFGYRTLLTLRDDNAWVAVHRATAPWLVVAGLGPVAAGITGVVLALLGVESAIPAVIGSAIGWLIVWVVISFIPAVAAERRYRRQLAAD